jgi:hypothetical protein
MPSRQAAATCGHMTAMGAACELTLCRQSTMSMATMPLAANPARRYTLEGETSPRGDTPSQMRRSAILPQSAAVSATPRIPKAATAGSGSALVQERGTVRIP